MSPDPHFYDHLAGNAPFIKSPAYGASKAGVVNLSKFFATHWAGAGVRVNTLSPGGVLAGQDEQFKAKYGARVPLRRMAEAEDLKGPLVFLASRASSYVTGHELRVDGGFTAGDVRADRTGRMILAFPTSSPTRSAARTRPARRRPHASPSSIRPPARVLCHVARSSAADVRARPWPRPSRRSRPGPR